MNSLYLQAILIGVCQPWDAAFKSVHPAINYEVTPLYLLKALLIGILWPLIPWWRWSLLIGPSKVCIQQLIMGYELSICSRPSSLEYVGLWSHGIAVKFLEPLADFIISTREHGGPATLVFELNKLWICYTYTIVL